MDRTFTVINYCHTDTFLYIIIIVIVTELLFKALKMKNHVSPTHSNTFNAILFDVRVVWCVVINSQVPLSNLTARRDFIR